MITIIKEFDLAVRMRCSICNEKFDVSLKSITPETIIKCTKCAHWVYYNEVIRFPLPTRKPNAFGLNLSDNYTGR